MNRLNFIILAVTLLLSQLGSLEHAYSEHESGEVCDYCVSTPLLDHAINGSVPIHLSGSSSQQHNEQSQAFLSAKTVRFYAARAPPHLI